jgi:hypothetical protein
MVVFSLFSKLPKKKSIILSLSCFTSFNLQLNTNFETATINHNYHNNSYKNFSDAYFEETYKIQKLVAEEKEKRLITNKNSLAQVLMISTYSAIILSALVFGGLYLCVHLTNKLKQRIKKYRQHIKVNGEIKRKYKQIKKLGY